MHSRLIRRTGSLALAAALLAAPVLLLPQTGQAARLRQPAVTVIPADHHDVSAPLREMAAHAPAVTPGSQREIPLLPTAYDASAVQQPEGALQTTTLGPVSATIGLSFDGVNDSVCNCVPSDSNGAVGATQFVEWVNTAFAVYDKTTGALVLGPLPGNTLWSGFGGVCQTSNFGDIIAQYDKAAQRWVMAQFAGPSNPDAECVAVSTTSDATGTFNRYQFNYPNMFDDYPKMGIWPDAYYMSYNMFNFQGTRLLGPEACALDRASMLAGANATQQCFGPLGSSFSTLLPSDLDGTTTPPTGEPDFYVDFGTNALNLWQFHVDWANPSNSTFTGPTNIPVKSFTPACPGETTPCVPQAGTSQKLDSLGDRLMYRFAYRNFGTHESLLVNHAVLVATGRVGIRWYELRSPETTPTVFQQATFSPDTTSRWMASMAMDKRGDIAMGYSASSTSIHPAIRYTGRVPTDPRNTMETEATILQGNGSQHGSFGYRWGDYTSMSIDPVDDCTFWYTNQYLQTSGDFNWSTHVATLKFPGCH